MRSVAVLLAVLVSAALAGCVGSETLKEHERQTQEDEEFTTFSVAKGTDRLRIRFSTEGSPASAGVVELVVAPQSAMGPSGDAYIAELAHGATDEGVIDDPPAGTWIIALGYEEYTGPASVKVTAEGGGAFFEIGGTFWDITGFALGVLTVVGGFVVFKRQTNRLNREMQRIDETFRELRVSPEQCRAELQDTHEDLGRQLRQGRLKESHYQILERRIERYLEQLDKVPAPLAGKGDDETPLELD